MTASSVTECELTLRIRVTPPQTPPPPQTTAT